MIRLEHCAISPHPQNPEASILCELWFTGRYSGAPHYVFLSRTLAGEEVKEERGSFLKCRKAWLSIARAGIPYWIEARA